MPGGIITGKLDIETKEYVKRPHVFADLFNYLIYGGNTVIHSNDLTALDSTEAFIPFDSKGVAYPTQKFRDVLKTAVVMQDSKAVYALILGVENQTNIHYAMPVKNMAYDAFNYAAQVSAIARKHRKGKDPASDEEFLSGTHKDDKLLPVITLVVYFGQAAWDGAMSIHEMLETDDPAITRFVPNYRINLIAPTSMEESEINKFKSDFKQLALYIKRSKDKEALKQLIESDESYKHLNLLTASIANKVTGSELKLEADEKGEVDMCVAIAGIREDGRIEGELLGENRLATLIQKLLSLGRNDDVQKVSVDANYRLRLMKEFGLK